MHILGVSALVVVAGIVSVDSLVGLAVTVGSDGAEVWFSFVMIEEREFTTWGIPKITKKGDLAVTRDDRNGMGMRSQTKVCCLSYIMAIHVAWRESTEVPPGPGCLCVLLSNKYPLSWCHDDSEIWQCGCSRSLAHCRLFFPFTSPLCATLLRQGCGTQPAPMDRKDLN
jgi:hypothetical protein